MHVYAPGTSYRPLTIALDSEPSIRIHDAVYPPPTPYVFEPLNEQVLVYRAPFRVVRDITVGEIEATRATMPERARIVIRGHLEYQACDATVCYLPESVPFERIIRIIDDGAGEVPRQTRK
jgi:DsbC/DsbD-like thiol-disulfide interchange protein